MSYAAGLLPVGQRAEVERHAELCLACRFRLDVLEQAFGDVVDDRDDPSPPAVGPGDVTEPDRGDDDQARFPWAATVTGAIAGAALGLTMGVAATALGGAALVLRCLARPRRDEGPREHPPRAAGSAAAPERTGDIPGERPLADARRSARGSRSYVLGDVEALGERTPPSAVVLPADDLIGALNSEIRVLGGWELLGDESALHGNIIATA